MRTTLKRGVGRGHVETGNGKMQLPPARCRADRDLPPARPAAAEPDLTRPRDPRVGVPRCRGRRLRRHRRRVSLPARDGGCRRAEERRREDHGPSPGSAGRRAARDGARDRLRPEGGRGEERTVPLRHADARSGQPEERHHLAALLPSRSAGPTSSARAGRRTRGRSTPPMRTAARRERSRPSGISPAFRSTT